MDEQVLPTMGGVRWNRGVPDAVLIVTETGLAALALYPHPDDDDSDCDEALPGHRLYERGLAGLTWAGIVEHSGRIASLEQRNRVRPGHDAERFSQLRHYILPLKEDTAEVIAETVAVQRHPGPALHAASLALRSSRMQ